MWECWFPRGKGRLPAQIWTFLGLSFGLCGVLWGLFLAQGTYFAKGLITALLLLWGGVGVFFLRRAGLHVDALCLCLLPLGLALLLRALCLEHVTLDYQDFLAQWVSFFRANGGFSAIREPVGNYNVPYLYFLAAISYLPVPDLYLIKVFSIFFDLLLAFAGLRLTKRVFQSDWAAALAFSLLLLLPTVILNGAYWGQCDSLYGALVLLALADTLDKHPGRGGVWLGISFAFKLQSVFLIPLWCILWYSGRVKFRHLLLFPATNLLICLPALALGKPLKDILGVYVGQTTQYSAYLTMNAPSVYAYLPYGMEVDTALWAKVGIAAAFTLVLAVLLWLFFFRTRLTDEQILTAGLIFAIGVPLLLPHMHDRYFFLADTFAVVWACRSWKRAAVPVAVQISSLGAYHAYLVLRYAFPMRWGTTLNLAALLGLTVFLARSLARTPSSAHDPL